MFTLPSKFVRIEEAVSQIRDGAVVMIGGFGAPGTPFLLIEELVRQGPRHLTIIKNDANETGSGLIGSWRMVRSTALLPVTSDSIRTLST